MHLVGFGRLTPVSCATALEVSNERYWKNIYDIESIRSSAEKLHQSELASQNT